MQLYVDALTTLYDVQALLSQCTDILLLKTLTLG